MVVTAWIKTRPFSYLRSRDAIWRHRCGSRLADLMDYCMTAPIHYPNQCGLIISKVQWHSSEGNFTTDTSATNQLDQLDDYLCKISFKSPRINMATSTWTGAYMQEFHRNKCGRSVVISPRCWVFKTAWSIWQTINNTLFVLYGRYDRHCFACSKYSLLFCSERRLSFLITVYPAHSVAYNYYIEPCFILVLWQDFAGMAQHGAGDLL